MVVHFTLIGRVLEQTGSSRQKTLQFQYLESRAYLETLELQYFETDTNQMRSDGTYFVQGTALLQDDAKPKVNQPMHVISFDDSNQMTDLLSSF